MLKKRLVALLLGLLFLYPHVYADTYLKITPQELNLIDWKLNENSYISDISVKTKLGDRKRKRKDYR